MPRFRRATPELRSFAWPAEWVTKGGQIFHSSPRTIIEVRFRTAVTVAWRFLDRVFARCTTFVPFGTLWDKLILAFVGIALETRKFVGKS